MLFLYRDELSIHFWRNFGQISHICARKLYFLIQDVPDMNLVWLNFFCPILEHFCPLLVQIAQMGLILPRWGLILPRMPSPTPVLYSAITNPFQVQGYVLTQNTPAPPQTTSFPGLILKVGKMNYFLGKMDPNRAQQGKMFEKLAKLF